MEKLNPKSTIVKQQTFGPFNVRILENEHGDYSVLYSGNGTRLEVYDSKDYAEAEQDYQTVCDAIRNVLAVIRQSLG